MSKRNPNVDAYLKKAHTWQREMKFLRTLVLDCGLTETMKWGKPCYTFEGSNVAILYRFKNCCALGFLRGSLLDDPEGILVSPGEHSQAMRRLQFTDVQEITRSGLVVKRYIQNAIETARAGLKVDFKQKNELALPEELDTAFDEQPELKQAFDALTPGRQRGYLLHFVGAKQSKTRAARIKKCAAKILQGKGLNDR